MDTATVQVFINGDFADAITGGLTDFDHPAALIDICYKLRPGSFLQDFGGIDIAYEKALAGEKVVLYGFLTEEHLLGGIVKNSDRHDKLIVLMTMPNVVYLEAPFSA